MLQPNTSDHVHHILVYKCHDLTGTPAASSSDVCSDIHEEAIACQGDLLIAGWAIGGGVRIIFALLQFKDS